MACGEQEVLLNTLASSSSSLGGIGLVQKARLAKEAQLSNAYRIAVDSHDL